jgi:hypothetical protein
MHQGTVLLLLCTCRVWLQRIRVLYTFIHAGVSVILSDLDAIWMQNAADDLLSKAGGHERGFDLLMSPGYFPFDVHKQMGVVGKTPPPTPPTMCLACTRQALATMHPQHRCRQSVACKLSRAGGFPCASLARGRRRNHCGPSVAAEDVSFNACDMRQELWQGIPSMCSQCSLSRGAGRAWRGSSMRAWCAASEPASCVEPNQGGTAVRML